MKNFYFLSMLFLISISGFAQITTTTYRGAFAPAPTAMWTDNWTNFDPQNAVYPATNVDVTTNITTDTHWTAGNTYFLKAQIYVKNNATLTIDEGVVIRGDHTAVGAGLFVTKGAKVIAIGTPTSPIVFTSDNAAGSRNKGDWGGVILLGKASYNINGGVNNIEGIAASADTEYGGGTTPDDNDNSGTLQYVRIEFGGYIYAANQEINGLTFGAVGRGTTIDNVQVSFANDDSYEWFGGAVNCTHLVAYRGLDDDFDTDNGFSGKVQFCLGVRDPQISDNPLVSTSEGFESDNNATSTAVSPYTAAVFTNCTMVGPSFRLTLPNGGTLASGYKRAARLRRNTQLKIYNSVMMDYQEGLHIDGNTTETNALNNDLRYKNNILAGIVTTSKVLQVNTSANNPSFNIATWYAANNNTTAASSAGILTAPYNTSDATIYTGLDYRPATGSIAATGADFTDSFLVLGVNNVVSNNESSLIAYPNPFANNFKLSFVSTNSDDVQVSAYDMTGRIIETKTVIYSEINSQEFGGNFQAGIYIITLKQGSNSKTVRIIKN
jgi:Secretion system C-terminal sorting domain